MLNLRLTPSPLGTAPANSKHEPLFLRNPVNRCDGRNNINTVTHGLSDKPDKQSMLKQIIDVGEF